MLSPERAFLPDDGSIPSDALEHSRNVDSLANLGGGNLRGTAHVLPEELSDPETIV